MPVSQKGTALVTGASSGIGFELSTILAAEGYDLVLLARNADALERLGADLTARHGVRSHIIVQDLTSPTAPVEIEQELRQKNIAVDILINNAGFGNFGLFANNDLKSELELLQVNIVALTALTRFLLPGMIARRRGYILNVASTAAFQPGPLMATYYASKAYVLSFSTALGNELRGTGVSVTTLCPGPTVTDFQRRANMERSGLMKQLGTMTARRVAGQGYRAMLDRKPIVVTGWLNRLAALSTRFTSRPFAAAAVRKIQKETP